MRCDAKFQGPNLESRSLAIKNRRVDKNSRATDRTARHSNNNNNNNGNYY